MIKFEWDKKKNNKNISKHGVNFVEASTAFLDDNALLIKDDKHSKEEERFILLGMSSMANLLVICHCYRSKDEIIRIISARKATKKEEKQYVEGLDL